jgi:hypothetical protein
MELTETIFLTLLMLLTVHLVFYSFLQIKEEMRSRKQRIADLTSVHEEFYPVNPRVLTKEDLADVSKNMHFFKVS